MRSGMWCALAVLTAGLLGAGSGCIDIADSFELALVLPAEYCFAVGPSTDTVWSGQDEVSIRSLVDDVDASYGDDIRATRVTDVIVRVTGPYPSGAGDRVAGQADFRLGSGPWTPLVTADAPYASLAEGVSLLDPDPSLVTFDPSGVSTLVAALTSSSGLPADDLLQVRASGTTAPVPTSGVQVCYEIVLGADAEVRP